MKYECILDSCHYSDITDPFMLQFQLELNRIETLLLSTISKNYGFFYRQAQQPASSDNDSCLAVSNLTGATRLELLLTWF